MSDDFRKVIEKLWLALHLRTPSFTGRTVLTVEGLDLELSAAADGQHMVVTGIAGRLSPHPGRCAVQVDRILHLSLQHLACNAACVGLDENDDGVPTVVVRGITPCDCREMDRLAQTISDVASLTETSRRELEEHSYSPYAPNPRPVAQTTDTLIVFEP